MNKKIALKRKKLVSQIRHHRVLPNGRILSADGRETLLGNLAPVKQIPMLPWRRVMVFPTETKTISVAVEGKNAWLYRMLEEYSRRAHDLIGFTPVSTLGAETVAQIGAGSVGIAVQVQEIEPPENGRATVHLKGICRYENVGFQPLTEDYFRINVRWFEDDREADARLKPEFEKCLRIFHKISAILTNSGIEGFEGSREDLRYDFTAVQYLSFKMLEGAQNYFEEEEKRELLCLRSTWKRFLKLNEYFEGLLAETERRFTDRAAS